MDLYINIKRIVANKTCQKEKKTYDLGCCHGTSKKYVIAHDINCFFDNTKHCETTRTYELNIYKKIINKINQTKIDFTCDVCQKSFKNRKAMTKHRYAVHEKRFKCKYCNKGFAWTRSMNLHITAKHK